MTEMILLSEAQMARISPFFPLSHGVPRVDDRRVVSGIIFVIRNGLRWRDLPASYGPHKTIYNPLHHQRNRQHPPCRPGALRPARRPAQRHSRQLHPRDRNPCHARLHPQKSH